MQRLKIIALALCIFLSGILAGAFGMRLYVQRAAQDVMAGNSAFAERLVMSRLNDALDLSKGQKARLAPLVAEAARQLGEARREFIPRVNAILEETAQSMRPELSPTQWTKLEELLARFEKVRRDPGLPAAAPERQESPGTQ